MSEREGLILVTRGDLELTCGARRDEKWTTHHLYFAYFLPYWTNYYATQSMKPLYKLLVSKET